MLRIVSETDDFLRAVGIMYVLGTGEFELPMEVELSKQRGSISYSVRIGINDARWRLLTDSKRWKAVYLYSIGEREEEWNWSEPVSGAMAYS